MNTYTVSWSETHCYEEEVEADSEEEARSMVERGEVDHGRACYVEGPDDIEATLTYEDLTDPGEPETVHCPGQLTMETAA